MIMPIHLMAATTLNVVLAAAVDKPTKAIHIGHTVPDFSVTTLGGRTRKLSDLQKPGNAKHKLPIVISFWCATCDSCRNVERPLAKLATEYRGKAVVLALDSNAGETRRQIKRLLKEKKIDLTVALDAKGKVADLFRARVTTTSLIIDANGVLRYRGRFSQRGKPFVRNALTAVLAGKKVSVRATRPVG